MAFVFEPFDKVRLREKVMQDNRVNPCVRSEKALRVPAVAAAH